MRRGPRATLAKIAPTDPSWEAMKAARRNIGHDTAAQEVDLNLLLRTLTEKNVAFVLTGTHGISGWTGRPRATKDIDILVKGSRTPARVVKIIRALYPQLEVRSFAGLTAFFLPGEKESVIHVVYPHRADIEETLAKPVWTENKEQGLRYRVPTLETAPANKYGAMIIPNRNLAKRQQDVTDFIWMVLHSMDEGRQPIDRVRLEALGEMVWPGGGGAEILRLVDKVKAGRAIQIDGIGEEGQG